MQIKLQQPPLITEPKEELAIEKNSKKNNL
jgi:hypothetical protein